MSTHPATLDIPAAPARRASLPAWLRPVAAVWGGWTALWVFTLAQQLLLAAATGRPGPTPEMLFWGLESVWLWAAFTPAIFALARRFPLEREGWRRNLAIHAAAAIGFLVLDVACDYVVTPLTGFQHRGSFGTRVLARSFVNLFSYAGLVGIALVLAYRREAAQRRERAAELERELLQARLQAIEAQIHPHFLFNTLHTAASLVRAGEDRGAIQVLVGLSDLLRAALRTRDTPLVPLDEELAFVRRYLEVEGVRFQDRLRVELVVEPGVPGDALVPHMILQPLVENAIRHGVESRAAAGRVTVRALVRDGVLTLRVEDDGPGPAAPSTRGGRGIGLGATRERLRHLYGDGHRFALEPGVEGGAVATVAIPLRRGAEERRG